MLNDRNIERRAAEKLHLVFRHLVVLTAGCRITTLELFFENDFWVGYQDDHHPWSIKGQDPERLAGVFALHPSLSYLNLSENGIGLDGVQSLAGVLVHCRAGSPPSLRLR
jgi:hypothetical protein